MLAGGRLLVAGTFVGPTGIASLVSLDPSTGEVDTAWAPDRQGGPISQTSGLYAIEVVGNTAYIGGNFTTFGGPPRSNVTNGVVMGRTIYLSYVWSGTLVSNVVAADANSGVPVTSTRFSFALGALHMAAADGLLFAVGRRARRRVAHRRGRERPRAVEHPRAGHRQQHPRASIVGTSLGPATVAYGRTYYVRVRAVNAAGVGPPSTEYVLVAR